MFRAEAAAMGSGLGCYDLLFGSLRDFKGKGYVVGVDEAMGFGVEFLSLGVISCRYLRHRES